MDEWKNFSQLLVSFSGGKDSTACLLWALETGKPVRAIFADTGNEPPETQNYIAYIERALEIKIEQYRRDELGHDFFTMVRKRGQWPMAMKCNVSKANKSDDFHWYLKRTNTPMNAIIILGQRRDESRRRRALPYFSEFVDSGRAAYRPILDWSARQVFEYLADHGIEAHPAYAKGRRRVGCVWCVNQGLQDNLTDSRLYPERCAQLRELRESIGLSSIPDGVDQLSFEPEPAFCIYEAVHCE